MKVCSSGCVQFIQIGANHFNVGQEFLGQLMDITESNLDPSGVDNIQSSLFELEANQINSTGFSDSEIFSRNLPLSRNMNLDGFKQDTGLYSQVYGLSQEVQQLHEPATLFDKPKPQETLLFEAPQPRGSAIDSAVGDPTSLFIRGLPSNTTEEHIRLLLAWSDDYHVRRIFPEEPSSTAPGFAAEILFMTMAGAQKAKHLLETISNDNRVGKMTIELATTTTLQTTKSLASRPKGRHKFTALDTFYLKEIFGKNPRPSVDARREFARHLGVDEKLVTTWFNNYRQRQQKDPSFSQSTSLFCTNLLTFEAGTSETGVFEDETAIPNAMPLPITGERLEQLSVDQQSMSPIERFIALPSGSEGEPDIEAIEAASHGILEASNPAPSYQFSIYSAASDLDARSAFGHSTSSQSYGSTISSWSHSYSGRKRHGRGRRGLPDKYKYAKLGTNPPPQEPPPQDSVAPILESTCYQCSSRFDYTFGSGKTDGKLVCLGCKVVLGTCNRDGTVWPKELKFPCRRCGPESLTDSVNLDSTRLAIGQRIVYNCQRCSLRNYTITLRKLIKYQCTFCERRYGSRYGWERHETTKHEPREVWICCRTRGQPESIDPRKSPGYHELCIFCKSTNTRIEHMSKVHRWQDCANRPLAERSFTRKDELAQHLRIFHKSSLTPEMTGLWRKRIDQSGKVWRCGICGEIFLDWKKRLRHVAEHWESGESMADWDKKLEGRRGVVGFETFGRGVEGGPPVHPRPQSTLLGGILSGIWGKAKSIISR